MNNERAAFEAWWNPQQLLEQAPDRLIKMWCEKAWQAASATKVDGMRDLVKIQCSNGNWNYDPYMHGMANGMIMLLAMVENKEPEYLKAPDVWLKDLPQSDTPAPTNNDN